MHEFAAFALHLSLSLSPLSLVSALNCAFDFDFGIFNTAPRALYGRILQRWHRVCAPGFNLVHSCFSRLHFANPFLQLQPQTTLR